MLKVKRVLILFFISLSLISCSRNVTKEEALELANPIINSVLKYKKITKQYPKYLSDIKGFPYKIRSYTSSPYQYYLEKDNSLILNAGRNGDGAVLGQDYVYRIMIDFGKSRGSKAITSIFVGFREDGSYKILYTRMPPAWKQ